MKNKYPSYRLTYHNEELEGQEALNKVKELESLIDKKEGLCCQKKEDVGKWNMVFAPLAARGFTMKQCPTCQKIFMELAWMS